MFCPKCDKHYGSEYNVCPECGSPLRKETSDFDNPVVNPTYNGVVVQDKSVTYILLSVAMLFCCSPLAGIVALILSIIGSSNFKKGDYEGAESMWKASKITLWVGVGLCILSIVLSVLFVGGSIMTMFSELM